MQRCINLRATSYLAIRYSLRSCYFQTPIPLSPFPHGKGERITQASVPMRAQSSALCALTKEQENPMGFPALSFRQPSAAADCARSESRNEIVRCQNQKKQR